MDDPLWDALNARLFLLVTKENTSVEWKQAIGCRVAQVASKWCYTHGRVWNKDGPKYSDCLKFPKTPFSHLWSALQCALCILEIVFSFLHSECFFLQIASSFYSVLSLSGQRLNLSFYDYLTVHPLSSADKQQEFGAVSVQAVDPKVLPPMFSRHHSSESFSLSLLISSPFHAEAEDSHQPYYDSTPSTLLSLFNKKVGAPWRWWISFWLIQAQKWWKSRHAWQTKIWWPACRNCPDNLKTVWTIQKLSGQSRNCPDNPETVRIVQKNLAFRKILVFLTLTSCWSNMSFVILLGLKHCQL